MKEEEEMKNEKMEQLYDTRSAAEVLAVSPKTLEFWRWKKCGPHYIRVMHRIRYREQDLLDFLVQQNPPDEN